MITVNNLLIENIPTLVVEKKDMQNERLPTVIYYHGFTSAKEHNLPLAYLLAEKNYRVLLPDSLYHGAREEDVSKEHVQLSFWEIVLQNVKEFRTLYNYLVNNHYILDERVGVAGTSMGGITTAATLVQYPEVKTAAILMGTPKLTSFATELISFINKEKEVVSHEDKEELLNMLKPYDLSLHVDALNDRPLMFWHGEKDETIPFNQSFSFYEQLKRSSDDKKNIIFYREANSVHKVSRYAIIKTVDWFEKQL
ncbi:MAG TPA: alpha/beta fold hydrolase [Bacillota bacterium]|nr:alpha/beta fold hydrolase [Bacillota bacterium]